MSLEFNDHKTHNPLLMAANAYWSTVKSHSAASSATTLESPLALFFQSRLWASPAHQRKGRNQLCRSCAAKLAA
eukprot:4856339-Amphidinium_carterae.1